MVTTRLWQIVPRAAKRPDSAKNCLLLLHLQAHSLALSSAVLAAPFGALRAIYLCGPGNRQGGLSWLT